MFIYYLTVAAGVAVLVPLLPAGVASFFGSAVGVAVASGVGVRVGLGSTVTSGVGVGLRLGVAVNLPRSQTR